MRSRSNPGQCIRPRLNPGTVPNVGEALSLMQEHPARVTQGAERSTHAGFQQFVETQAYPLTGQLPARIPHTRVWNELDHGLDA
jgi:hypothetical protein